MTNNDLLRRLRYTFDYNDDKMISIFSLGEYEATRSDISNWLKKEEDPDYSNCTDFQFASFLNGLINEKRGKKDGPQHAAEKRLTNNLILRKLKIALDLKDDDVIHIMDLAQLTMSKHELSAFFRKPGHKNYRECKDQILRNFLKGVQTKYHQSKDSVADSKWNG